MEIVAPKILRYAQNDTLLSFWMEQNGMKNFECFVGCILKIIRYAQNDKKRKNPY